MGTSRASSIQRRCRERGRASANRRLSSCCGPPEGSCRLLNSRDLCCGDCRAEQAPQVSHLGGGQHEERMVPRPLAIDSGVDGLDVEPEMVFESDQLNIATRYFQAG